VASAELAALAAKAERAAWVGKAAPEAKAEARRFQGQSTANPPLNGKILPQHHQHGEDNDPLLVRRSSAILARPDFIDTGFSHGCV
jgi:hypothetical protein